MKIEIMDSLSVKESPKKSAMVPRDMTKATETRTPVSKIKKTMAAKSAQKILTKVNTMMQTRQRTSTDPKVATPKPEENKSVHMPGSVPTFVREGSLSLESWDLKTTMQTIQPTSPDPKVATPKPKENKSATMPGSGTTLLRKGSWKRRPKPAHSGVPLPEKMKRLSLESWDMLKTTMQTIQPTSPDPKVATPKPNENKSAPMPGSGTTLVRKGSWKRRPKPAHSGVPVPEKMKRLSLEPWDLWNLNSTMQTIQPTSPDPKVATPQPEENKSAPMPGSVTTLVGKGVVEASP